MKVILTSNVGGLGTKGDVVDVSPGYGRNFLLPKNLAIQASAGALKQADDLKRAKIEAEERELAAAESMKNQLAGTRIVIAAQAGDEGQLFGSVAVADIVEAVAKISGVQLERSTVTLTTPIRSIGLHEAQVNLHPEVQFPITVDVIPA
jgi:large subunit ribosomal protein L9